MRLFTHETPWEQARKDVRFTAAALSAIEEHAKLAKPMRDLLAQWNAIDQERRDAEDAVVDANAVVQVQDSRLDGSVADLIARLRFEFRSDDHPTVRKFFPERPSEVLRMGLESEIDRTRKFHAVGEEVGASKEVMGLLKGIAGLETAGLAALAQRVKAVESIARVSLRIQTWKENANNIRRSLETVLDGYANQHRLPRGYADDFFSPAQRVGKRGKPGQPMMKPAFKPLAPPPPAKVGQ
jgi:hypothetical protein